MKVVIKSDGTVQGTQVTLDGVDVTDKQQVMRVSFYASCMYSDGAVDFSYAIKEGTGEEDKIVNKSISQSKESIPNEKTAGIGYNDDGLVDAKGRVGSDFGVYTVDVDKLKPGEGRFIMDMVNSGVLKRTAVEDIISVA